MGAIGSAALLCIQKPPYRTGPLTLSSLFTTFLLHRKSRHTGTEVPVIASTLPWLVLSPVTMFPNRHVSAGGFK